MRQRRWVAETKLTRLCFELVLSTTGKGECPQFCITLDFHDFRFTRAWFGLSAKEVEKEMMATGIPLSIPFLLPLAWTYLPTFFDKYLQTDHPLIIWRVFSYFQLKNLTSGVVNWAPDFAIGLAQKLDLAITFSPRLYAKDIDIALKIITTLFDYESKQNSSTLVSARTKEFAKVRKKKPYNPLFSLPRRYQN